MELGYQNSRENSPLCLLPSMNEGLCAVISC